MWSDTTVDADDRNVQPIERAVHLADAVTRRGTVAIVEAQLGDDWQVVVGQTGARDLVVFHVELDDTSRQAAIEARIHNNLRERFADFWRNREMRLYELRIVVHTIGSLRGGARKLRRIVDERQMTRAPLTVST